MLVVNTSLSIPAELRTTSPADYHGNTATIGWPAGADGRVLPLLSSTPEAVVFAGGRDVEGAKDFLRFPLREKRVATWLEGAQGRWLPTSYELAGSPFWMDPADPHRRPAVERLGGPEIPFSGPVRGSLPVWWDEVSRERLLGGTVARVAVDGLTPEQAADELVGRLRQLLSR